MALWTAAVQSVFDHHSSQDGISLEIKKQLLEIRRDDVLRVELRKGRGRHIAIGAASCSHSQASTRFDTHVLIRRSGKSFMDCSFPD